MAALTANGVEIAYELEGPEGGPVVLLIMGLAAQLTAWPHEMLQALHHAGYRTLRFDNRDIGLSEKMEGRRAPNILWHSILSRLGRRGRAPYDLSDMAEDARALLDALKIGRAHVVGVSMGGMIAQLLAAAAPERVASLTAVMTSTNNPRLPGPRRDVMCAMLKRRPRNETEEQAIDRAFNMWRLIGTENGGQSDEELRRFVADAIRRCYYPAGVRRQTAAVIDTGDITETAEGIAAPTLVIHGDADPLVKVAGGRALAAAIPGARLAEIHGMGHDLPPKHVDHVTGLMLEHFRSAA